MNILNIDLDTLDINLDIDLRSLFPYVINAFSSVYGEEYHSIISKRINNAMIIQYYDLEGIKNYITYLEACKIQELSIRFLDEIGIDVQMYKDNYEGSLDDNTKEILDILINFNYAFSSYALSNQKYIPIFSFDDSNKPDSKELLAKKIKIINYFRGNQGKKITEKNFESYTETKEFEELLKKIDEYKMIYKKLLLEYKDWIKQLAPYRDDIKKKIKNERKKKCDILQKKKNEMFREIFEQLPLPLKDFLSDKKIEEQMNIVLGTSDLSSKFNIEYFRNEQMKKLKSSSINHNDKSWLANRQLVFLRKLGFDYDLYYGNNTGYLSFCNQDNIKKYIPSEEVITHISTLREKKYEEALREFCMTRAEVKEAMEHFSNYEAICEPIEKNMICIEPYRNDNNELYSIMFYPFIKFNYGGLMGFSFMHECGHIIDGHVINNGVFVCGFDGGFKNPYDNKFRKYEKFNETLEDMFTMEAIEYLQSQGIYLIEPKEITKLDVSNHNTDSLTKNLLRPLVQKFRKQVIRAKINSNPQELTKYIGEDNFEELVDAVNKVDYLKRNGLISKDEPLNYSMIKEYYNQFDRVKQIYINIDNYSENRKNI